jgi:arylsulfatase
MFKHYTEEGGIAAPFIAYWPAKIKSSGKIVSEVGHVIDLMPTFIDVADAKYPQNFRGNEITPLEGKSLVPAFSSKKIKDRMIFWEHEGNRAVRSGNWKLVAEFKKDWELYDLEKDRTELHNLALENPEKVKELSAAYDAWARRCDVLPWDEVRK